MTSTVFKILWTKIHDKYPKRQYERWIKILCTPKILSKYVCKYPLSKKLKSTVNLTIVNEIFFYEKQTYLGISNFIEVYNGKLVYLKNESFTHIKNKVRRMYIDRTSLQYGFPVPTPLPGPRPVT